MLVIGHRGASDASPENTLAAFQGALDHGRRRRRARRPPHRRRRPGASATTTPSRRTGARGPGGRPSCPPPEVPDPGRGPRRVPPAVVVNIEIKNWPDDRDFDPHRAPGRRPWWRCSTREASSTTGEPRVVLPPAHDRPGPRARARRSPRPGSSAWWRTPRRLDRAARPSTATWRSTRTTRSWTRTSSTGPTTPASRSTPGRATTPTGSAGWPSAASTRSSPTCLTSPSRRSAALRRDRLRAQGIDDLGHHPGLDVAGEVAHDAVGAERADRTGRARGARPAGRSGVPLPSSPITRSCATAPSLTTSSVASSPLRQHDRVGGEGELGHRHQQAVGHRRSRRPIRRPCDRRPDQDGAMAAGDRADREGDRLASGRVVGSPAVGLTARRIMVARRGGSRSLRAGNDARSLPATASRGRGRRARGG